MKKNLFTAFILLTTFVYSQDCNFSVASENTGNGGNISTGGLYEYYSATDFDVPFGKIFTLNQVKFNAIKGAADVEYVKVSFYKEEEGMPGEILHSFPELIPVEQTFLNELDIEGMDLYEISINMPSSIDFPKGKYFLDIQAASGDEYMIAWEIAGELTPKLGRFDISKFESDPWSGGFSYYDQVFELVGDCTETGEEQPEMGEFCQQGNPTNEHETVVSIPGFNLADDFIVPENSVFHLSNFRISTMQLGNLQHATVKIRKDSNGQPGEILYTMENKGPKTENFYGYWPLEGFPLDVVAVESEFELEEILDLEAGTYYLEISVQPFPFTDILGWEATSLPGIGGGLFWSTDQGETWNQEDHINFVFSVEGHCESVLGIEDGISSEFNFYPNPAKDEMYFQSNSEVKKAEIFSLSGQLIQELEVKNQRMSLNHLPKGIYMVRTTLANNKIETFKLIKS